MLRGGIVSAVGMREPPAARLSCATAQTIGRAG